MIALILLALRSSPRLLAHASLLVNPFRRRTRTIRLRGAVAPSARTLAASLDNLDAADTVAVVAVVARVAAAVETVPAMESQGARAAEVVVSANAAPARRVAPPLRCACCTC